MISMSRTSRRSLLLVTALALTQFVVAPPARAVGSCYSTVDPNHAFAHQYDPSQTLYGLYGRFFTYAPYVYNISTDFTLDHLYFSKPYGNRPWAEVGWYKGQGVTNVPTPHYYWTRNDQYVGYDEHDSADYPDVASTRLYELLYTGHDYSTNKEKWSFFWRDLTSAKATTEVSGLPGGIGLAGGEVSGGNGDSTHMQAAGSSMQVQDTANVWHNWTTSVVTYQCADPGFSYQANTMYTNFAVDGAL